MQVDTFEDVGAHAADANAFASAQVAPPASDDSGSGFDWGEFGGKIIDRLQRLVNSWGLSYDPDTTLAEKSGMVRIQMAFGLHAHVHG